jgi:hypothetical protein
MVSHRRDACATDRRVAGQAAGRPERVGKMSGKGEKRRKGEKGRAVYREF